MMEDEFSITYVFVPAVFVVWLKNFEGVDDWWGWLGEGIISLRLRIPLMPVSYIVVADF